MTTAATAEESIDAETLPREKEERARTAQTGGSRGGTEKDQTTAGGLISRRHAGLRRLPPAAP